MFLFPPPFLFTFFFLSNQRPPFHLQPSTFSLFFNEHPHLLKPGTYDAAIPAFMKGKRAQRTYRGSSASVLSSPIGIVGLGLNPLFEEGMEEGRSKQTRANRNRLIHLISSHLISSHINLIRVRHLISPYLPISSCQIPKSSSELQTFLII